ncbi:MAG: hypothetical protein M1584_03690 [Deltaproteobacteria bacterium]|jgi:hypothetical protein|nr:hypothetical protein [Deltaproteobacteria bacterium]
MGCKNETNSSVKNGKTPEDNNDNGGREAGQNEGMGQMKAGMKTGMGMRNRMMGGMGMGAMMPPMAKRMMGEAQTMAEVNEEAGPIKTGMGMMNKMMGKMKDENFNPMEMCRCMEESVATTAEIAGLATPEVRALFEDWASEVEKEILTVIKEEGQINPLSIAQKFKISEDSALYFISKLVRDKKIKVNAEFADETLNEQTAQTGEADAKTKGDVTGESSQAANTECAGGVCSVDTAAAETKKTRQK